MTTNKNFKARVRERMARTGESYTAARAHVAKESESEGRAGDSVAMPAERRHLRLTPHKSAFGDYPWDRWLARAQRAGLPGSLAQLGRSLMREADQHGWCAELWERCGWTELSAEGMIRFALASPKVAGEHWTRLMETDGLLGVLVDSGLRELPYEEFERDYRAFALAFDVYFPASRAAAEDPDPFVEIPGTGGMLAPRSKVEKVAAPPGPRWDIGPDLLVLEEAERERLKPGPHHEPECPLSDWDVSNGGTPPDCECVGIDMSDPLLDGDD